VPLTRIASQSDLSPQAVRRRGEVEEERAAIIDAITAAPLEHRP